MGTNPDTTAPDSRRDVGIAAIDEIFKLWQVDEVWSLREGRGFTWWGGDFRQRVWVDDGREDNGIFVYQLSAVTDFVRGVDAQAPAVAELLADLNRFASSYAITLDAVARRVGLCSSVVLHEQNAEWIVHYFSALSIIQPIDSQIRAGACAEMLAGTPDTSCHPSSGVRFTHDDMLNLIDAVYRPRGQEPSQWVSSGEFEQIPLMLSKYGFFSTGGKDGLSAELSFGNETALITADGDQPHPQLGNGVLLLLKLPVTLSASMAAWVATELNATDVNNFAGAHLMGAWCSTEVSRGRHIPVFASFVPNILFRPGLLLTLILSLGQKARWARTEIAPYVGADIGLPHPFNQNLLERRAWPQ
jgi:hypothetical protein